MSLGDVQSEILEPMQRIYLPPRNMDAEQQRLALQAYGDVLKNYSGEDLKGAWLAVISTHTSRSWPLPAALLLAVRKSRSQRVAETGNPERERYPWEPQDYTANRIGWDRIRSSQMAREAARDGFSWSLKCRVMNDGLRAEQIDTRELSAEHNSAMRTADSLEKGERVWDRFRNKYVRFSDENREIALKMWRHVLNREAETAEETRRAE